MNNVDTVVMPAERTAALLAAAAQASPPERALLEEEVVRAHLPLATRIAARYRQRGIDLDDLRQVACVALVKAIRRFEPTQGDFVPFAGATISGEIKRYFRDHGWTIRPSRDVQELQADITRATQTWLQDHSAEPSTKDLSVLLGVEPAKVAEAVAARGLFQPSSLDRELGHESGGRTLGDRFAAVDGRLDLAESWIDLAHACQHLDEEDRELLELRFFRDMTQQQIADLSGVSQMQISRRLRGLLAKIREDIDVTDAA